MNIEIYENTIPHKKKEKYLPVCGSTNLSKLYKRAIFFTTLAVLKKIATVIHIQNIHICAELKKKKNILI